MGMPTRREVLRIATTSSIVACAPALVTSAFARAPAEPSPTKVMNTPTINTRIIPKTKDAIRTVGRGTWQAVDVDAGSGTPQAEVMRQFLAAGGRVIDSSPMYGRAEERVGDVLADLGAIGEGRARGVGTPTALPAGRGSSPVGSIG